MRRRRWPVALVVFGVFAMLVWYVVYTRQVVTELRAAAALQGRMYSRVYRELLDTSRTALSCTEVLRAGGSSVDRRGNSGNRDGVGAIDTTGFCPWFDRLMASREDNSAVLIELADQVKASGIPLVITDAAGEITAAANLPTNGPIDTAALVRDFDKRNAPIIEPALGGVHYGDSEIVRGLRVIPLLQAAAIGLLLLFGVYALVERGRAEREKVWAGMAREAAHQLGTPLSAMAGWLELLGEQANTPTSARAVVAMTQDLARLERVSHRFERIGRPPRDEGVDCAALVDRLANYFAARAPTLARKVSIRSEHPDGSLMRRGDGVLLEWVLEVLIKNAIDALGGRDGDIIVSAQPQPEGGVRIRVQDNGPGIPPALRKRIFDAGFTTKDRGWGIGLSLARRIVEENHGGKLLLADTDSGAAFDVILPG